jgi:hypothetical protein
VAKEPTTGVEPVVALRGHQVRVGTAVAGRGLQHSMTVKNALRRRLV